MSKKIFSIPLVVSVLLTGCPQLAQFENESLVKPRTVISSSSLSPSLLPTSQSDLDENEFHQIEAIILADVKRESILKNIPITVIEIIPSSSGNTRVLIQFMTRVIEPQKEYTCGYTVWFYQNNGVWHHKNYHTDDTHCEFSL